MSNWSDKNLLSINTDKIKNIHESNGNSNTTSYILLVLTFLAFYYILDPLNIYENGLILNFVCSQHSLDYFIYNSKTIGFEYWVLLFVSVLSLFGIQYLEKVLMGDPDLYIINDFLVGHSNEFFLIRFLKSLAYVIEISIASMWISTLRRIAFILAFVMILYAAIFDPRFWVLARLTFVYFSIFCVLLMLYVAIHIEKYYYSFTFPAHFISNTTIMKKLNYYHEKLNTDEHLGSLLQRMFINDILEKPMEFGHYIQKADFSSAVRVLWMALIKYILKIFFKITINLSRYLKSKYLYYMLMPVVKTLTLIGDTIIIITYNILMAIFIAILSVIYCVSIVFWMLFALFFAFVTLIFNIISFHEVVDHYQDAWYLGALIIVYLTVSIGLGVIQYGALPVFTQRYNPLRVMASYQNHSDLLSSTMQKSFFVICTFTSISVVAYFTYYFILEYVLIYDFETNYEIIKQFYVDNVNNLYVLIQKLG